MMEFPWEFLASCLPLLLADDARRPRDRGQLDRLGHHLAEGDEELVQPAPRQPRVLRLHLPVRLHPREHQVKGTNLMHQCRIYIQ